MTFNPFRRRREKEFDVAKFVRKSTIIPSPEAPWPRSPYGPRTLEENLRLMERVQRVRRQIDED